MQFQTWRFEFASQAEALQVFEVASQVETLQAFEVALQVGVMLASEGVHVKDLLVTDLEGETAN